MAEASKIKQKVMQAALDRDLVAAAVDEAGYELAPAAE